MPKKPCDSIQGLRIELQQSEREALQMASAAQSIGSIMGGIGALLMPFQGAFTAFMTAWLAGEIADEVKEALDNIIQRNRTLLASNAAEEYSAFAAHLYPQSWPLDVAANREWIKSEVSLDWMRNRMYVFLSTSTMTTAAPMSSLGTPAEAWALFFPYEEMENEAIYHTNRLVNSMSWFHGLITPEPNS